MKIGLIVPPDTPATGGNFVSAERLKLGLNRLGIDAQVERFHPHLGDYDVYHAWNAVQVGQRLLNQGIEPEKILVTWTGTDLWGDWAKDPGPIRETLSSLRHQVVFTPNARKRLLADAPQWENRVHVIPPSVDETIFCPADSSQKRDGPPLVVIAGGIRPVKRSAWAIELVQTARQTLATDFQLAILGPVRDWKEWERVWQAAHDKPWVHVIGEVPKDQMGQWYQRATIVLNTSQIEGVSNALMEAMSCGALIVASNIHGNRYLIENGKTGLLFDTPEELIEAFRYALNHSKDADCIRKNARMRILSRHLPTQEAQAYAMIYRQIAWSMCSKGCGV
ncbi:glycosyltransferase [Sulfobacillus thermosulfidooxidans]|uniref:glycosyltransferase n=1 Tax=Sulfobacillus thermosulfidooxidans TaxID=28034 RepID=UPI0006B45112|nr:glycosyltransferase [Sulfobacillus thermosulfidooxidans]